MPSPAWRPTMPPASTTHRSAARTRRRTNAKYRRGGETTRQRRRRFQIGHQDRGRATIGVLDGPHPFEMSQVHRLGRGGKLRHPRRGLDQVAEPRKVSVSVIDPNMHRHRTTPSNPATVDDSAGPSPHRREDLWVRSSSTRSANSGSTTRRSSSRPPGVLASTYGPSLQEMRSTKLRQHKAAAVHGHAKPRHLRAEEVEPDWQDRDRSCVPVRQPQLVRREHVAATRSRTVRPLAGVVHCRRPRSQVRVVGQRKRLQAIGHDAHRLPDPALRTVSEKRARTSRGRASSIAGRRTLPITSSPARRRLAQGQRQT